MEKTVTFSLIGHPPSVSSVHNFLTFLKPEYRKKKQVKEKVLRSIFHWTPAFKVFDICQKLMKNSNNIDGIFVVATFFPDMFSSDRKEVISKVRDAIVLSEKKGAKIAALGGFTSIADGEQGAIVSKYAKKMKVTNGNTMTSALTIEGIKTMCKNLELKLSDVDMAIIGATGNIGKTCTKYFAGRTNKLVLTARNKERLYEQFHSYKDRNGQKVELSTDNDKAVKDADFVICVTSSDKSLFTADAFKSGAVICDVGFPKTVSANCSERSDIMIYSGGIATLPEPVEEAKLWGLNSSQMIFGCFAEAMTIAIEGCYELATVGSQDISLKNVAKIYELGTKHGFTLPPFSNSKKVYTNEDFEYFKSIRSNEL